MRAIFAAALLLVAYTADGQRVRGRLPLEAFTAVHGLPSDSVTDILPDSRGSMWFATLDGLSRFDGQEFVNYSTDDGLPDRMIWAVAEDRQGAIWAATSKGVASMTPSATRGRTLFKRSSTEPSTALFVDRNGTLWAECAPNLCTARNGRLEIHEPFRRAGGASVTSIVESTSGELWVGTWHGLFRRRRDGIWHRYVVQPHRTTDHVTGLMFDAENRIWIANSWGALVFSPTEPRPDSRPLAEQANTFLPGMTLRLPRPGEVVRVTTSTSPTIIHANRPYRSRDGATWLPTSVGLLRITPERIDLLGETDGLPATEMNAAREDPAGNLWIGTRGGGAYRLARGGATSYTRVHGLASERITSVFLLEDGSVCATNRDGLSCLRDGILRNGSLFPRDIAFRGWGWNQIVVRDRRGAWWFGTEDGLFEWPDAPIEDLGRIAPTRVYTTRDGLGAMSVFRVWQDSRGTLWVSTFGERTLSRRDPGSAHFVSFGPAEGFVKGAPTAFAEDNAGNVWIGAYTGELIRILRNGVLEQITNGFPGSMVRDLKMDSKGRLWVAAQDGLTRIDNPTAHQSRFIRTTYSHRNGLTSDSAYCVLELPDHRMAIGSQRGLDLLDLATNTVTHVSTRDGLASNEVSDLALDAKGGLWMATVGGLSHLRVLPQPRQAPPAQPRIAAIEVDGAPVAIPELGGTSIAGVRIEYPSRRMIVRYSASHFDSERALRFEYRLAQSERWSNVGSQRAVVFDRLPAGEGAFEVRAVAPDGATSPAASVSFVVIPAFWNRPVFLAFVIALAIAVAFAIHRSRVLRLLELQRMRLRVATDLHDDLGSNLSRISMLSEVAKEGMSNSGQRLLDEIAGIARDLVDSLGDSIWAIDPRRDDLKSVLLRLRHFTSAVFEAQSISADFHAPDDVATLRLDPERRRETYLILKEALNNIARHAAARNVHVTVTRVDSMLRITVEDDGKGFVAGEAVEREDGGRGIPNMTERARRAGGTFEIASAPGRGTRVTLWLSLSS
jgi:ligand-binding sensor domain-containing protein/signal transduction histidine kinase